MCTASASITRTVSLSRSRSSSRVIAPWNSALSNPSTSNWTGPTAKVSSFAGDAGRTKRVAVTGRAPHPGGMKHASRVEMRLHASESDPAAGFVRHAALAARPRPQLLAARRADGAPLRHHLAARRDVHDHGADGLRAHRLGGRDARRPSTRPEDAASGRGGHRSARDRGHRHLHRRDRHRRHHRPELGDLGRTRGGGRPDPGLDAERRRGLLERLRCRHDGEERGGTNDLDARTRCHPRHTRAGLGPVRVVTRRTRHVLPAQGRPADAQVARRGTSDCPSRSRPRSRVR